MLKNILIILGLVSTNILAGGGMSKGHVSSPSEISPIFSGNSEILQTEIISLESLFGSEAIRQSLRERYDLSPAEAKHILDRYSHEFKQEREAARTSVESL